MNYEWREIAEQAYALDIEVGLIIKHQGAMVFIPHAHLAQEEDGSWSTLSGSQAEVAVQYPELKYGCAVLCGND